MKNADRNTTDTKNTTGGKTPTPPRKPLPTHFIHPVSGFTPAMLSLIGQAKKLNQGSIYVIYVAIAVFLLFGTLQSLPQFKDNLLIYNCFYLMPYILVGLTIPITLYVMFILYRYRLSQASMLALCLAVGVGLFVLSGFNVTLTWLAFTAWLGMAFLFRANLTRFFDFIAENSTQN